MTADPSGGAVTSTPAPSDVPSLVELDRQEARARVLDAAFIYEDMSRGRDAAAASEAREALFASVRECRKAVAR